MVKVLKNWVYKQKASGPSPSGGLRKGGGGAEGYRILIRQETRPRPAPPPQTLAPPIPKAFGSAAAAIKLFLPRYLTLFPHILYYTAGSKVTAYQHHFPVDNFPARLAMQFAFAHRVCG
ncbi:hypothetical protein SKAU_G00051020 [Synaphobranchus kaupii]|uniref:Uncharacterized protein n=1 Tax=Synaphobranchus kaupii TaxID=118154 RepID=A0A9Q1J9S9_SYNKA|nr:hypothetical protein SKAU_G00051020 [Synaphobranchus kaupii]